MANVNDLVWVLPEGEKYEKATATIGGLEVVITKYDEDSYVVTNGENGHEMSFSALEKMVLEDKISWRNSTREELIHEKANTEISKFMTEDLWKSVKGVGKKVLEIPHAEDSRGTLRIIKLDDDSFKVAVLGIPPNDGANINYAELDLKTTLINYGYALGLGAVAGEIYYEKMKASAEHTDYEIIE